MRGWTSPASLAWLFGHIFLVLIGTILMTSGSSNQLGQSLAQSIGTGLMSTGIAGLVLFLYIRATDSINNKITILSEAGVLEVFRYRSVRIKEKYDKRLENAKKIDLIGYGLSSFLQDYAQEFVLWSQQADVRILLVDPDFPSVHYSLADLRDGEENRTAGEIRRQVERFEEAIQQMPDLNTQRFQVRRMRTIPAINMLRIDNQIFWGPYLMAEQSRNLPTLLVGHGGYMFDVFNMHFERTWRAAAQ